MSIEFFGQVYSVGDGFCYEGRIMDENGRKYHFVIDCGSQAPKRKQQRRGELSNSADCSTRINEICDAIVHKDKHIDLFILTHLHADHYNGMGTLFSSGVPDIIIMPYLYPEERAYLIAKNNMDTDDMEFLASPYDRTLALASARNPEVRLILIRGNNGDEREIDHTAEYSDDPVLWGKRYEEEEHILKLENLDSFHAEVVNAVSKGVKIFNYNWMFKFFNLEAEKDEVDILKKIAGSITAKDLYSKVSRSAELKKLKDQYKKISVKFYDDFNNTSIVTYHAPAGVYAGYKKYGTLITGDIDLNHDIIDLIFEYFKDEIDKIGLFSIPHHGSDHNWNNKLVDDGKLDGCVCFVSTHNYYANRITSSMMSDLRCHNISVVVVDENRFNEMEQIIWDYPVHYVRNAYRDKYEIIVQH